MKSNNVRVPQISSLKTAVELYYSKTELSNADIESLFGKCSSATVWRLKQRAREKMAELSVPTWNSNFVNTAAAFESWGLNIHDLEHRYKKLKEISA